MNNIEIIKYEGNDRGFIGLFKEVGNVNENDKLFAFYALTNGLTINTETEDCTIDMVGNLRTKFMLEKHYFLNIPIKINPKNGRGFTIIQINDESQYDLIKTVVESLL